MSAEYSEEIFDILRNYFIEDNWKFDADEERGIFSFNLSIDSKLKVLRYFVSVKNDSYTVYANSPIGADTDDENIMTEMAKFICRANYGLRNGNFEFDMRDGEIRYKVFVNCDGVNPSDQIIKESLIIPSVMFERYAAGMLDVMFKDSRAEDAISKCE
ncbi:MAG: hypothetical protein IJG51_05240 [Synergistaceae bacterium]|nr:hypothetical protein [Synergistaceae bacterium]MBQ3347802.1 hypothetical protein [Synergistaceae bacterium]MBQ3398270.1 hypothetical protein [Synergistaceae bacterium]MBQ3759839.1 hypothetical protein [Synergistaceae bacterium]MBQ4401627.1 hypothetical protein [Synergistaceae bacterium]